jgi:hypothetical protein
VAEYGLRLAAARLLRRVGAWQIQTIPGQPAGINPGFMGAREGWPGFMRNARPSTNIEDYRRARGKSFIAQ